MSNHYRFRKLEFWAERGMINIIDYRFEQSDPQFFKVDTAQNFANRLSAFRNELKRTLFPYADERREYARMISDGENCINEAIAQGCPNDPKAVADMLKDNRRVWMTNTETTMDKQLIVPVANISSEEK